MTGWETGDEPQTAVTVWGSERKIPRDGRFCSFFFVLLFGFLGCHFLIHNYIDVSCLHTISFDIFLDIQILWHNFV